MGFALYAAELGKKHDSAKPLTGNDKLRGVVEIVDDYDGDTYRCAYSAKLGNTVYVLHAFQKKSKHGIATPKRDLAIIEQRLKEAKQLHQEQEKERKKK